MHSTIEALSVVKEWLCTPWGSRGDGCQLQLFAFYQTRFQNLLAFSQTMTVPVFRMELWPVVRGSLVIVV